MGNPYSYHARWKFRNTGRITLIDRTIDQFEVVLPDSSTGIFDSPVCVPFQYYRKFEDGFRCVVDSDGIIFFEDEGNIFERPCMKLCIDVIASHSLEAAKGVLALSCELQNDPDITERARRDYLKGR